MIQDAYQFPWLVLLVVAKNALDKIFQYYSLSDSETKAQWGK